MAAEQHATPTTQEERTLSEYIIPDLAGVHLAICNPAIATNNFEIKPGTLQIMQSPWFVGLLVKTNKSIFINLMEICGTIKYNNVSEDAIQLLLFLLYSLGWTKMMAEFFAS